MSFLSPQRLRPPRPASAAPFARPKDARSSARSRLVLSLREDETKATLHHFHRSRLFGSGVKVRSGNRTVGRTEDGGALGLLQFLDCRLNVRSDRSFGIFVVAREDGFTR